MEVMLRELLQVGTGGEGPEGGVRRGRGQWVGLWA